MKNNLFRDRLKQSKLKQSIIELGIIAAFLLLIIISPTLLASEDNNNDVSSPYNLIIDDIICRDNKNTKCAFITKKYYQNIGDLVNPEEIADAKLRLGTLFQFRNVRIVLEKAEQRNHVVVVFIVKESEQVQYNVGLSYLGRKNDQIQSDKYSATVGVTDFNFLGTGKELGFSFLRGDSIVDLGITAVTIDENGQFVLSPARISQTSNQFGLSYYDPHLFDSKRYYLRSTIGYSRDSIEGIFSFIVNNLSTTTASLAFGKRFASHSYFELNSNYFDISGEVLPFEAENTINLVYGWDSRDDLLFPTKGSVFSAQLVNVTKENRESRAIGFSFSDNIAFLDDKVFDYAITARVNSKTTPFIDRFTNTYSTFTLSDINSSGSKDGNYSGWKYRIKIPLQNTRAKDISYGVSYIHQTDTLIMQFSLDYTLEEGNLF